MPNYTAPVADWQFLLHDVLRVQDHADLPGFADLTPEFTGQILEAAATFHQEVLHPLNLKGDAEGAHINDGHVRTPAGFVQAWQAYREAGWHRLSLPEALGGAGLPPVMAVPVSELRAATGHSFSMYSSFCAPTASMLSKLAPEWIRKHVVPKVSAGDWTATMCMTEPQAGTDLRQLTTRATPHPDGTWRVTGRKIFISGGDHDLTDNIIHIVLAKVPDEDGRIPSGLSSVCVFMVSKRMIDPQTGALGGANGVTARSIEHKMGIEGSATCALDFEDAVAWRISDERRSGSSANMAPMFLLMNYARVSTAMSGVGYAEIARQNAADYARERFSGRAGDTPRHPGSIADPIIAHADVRRLLLESRSFAEGARAGAMRAALWQSVAEHSPNPAERQRAADLLEVLTPVMKAFFTDRGFDATVACQQVLGGHGYIKDYGIEQYVRNARIAQLYEGSNGVQAMDLVQRKLTANAGRAQNTFLDTIAQSIDTHQTQPNLAAFVKPMAAAHARIKRALHALDSYRTEQPHALAGGAYDLLTALGILYVGWNWLEIAAAIHSDVCQVARSPELQALKLTLGGVWMERQLPLIDGLCSRIECGNASLMALSDAEI
ncbi:acyl-CoA dehydrogenase family protein [Hydrogenophaga aquatica]